MKTDVHEKPAHASGADTSATAQQGKAESALWCIVTSNLGGELQGEVAQGAAHLERERGAGDIHLGVAVGNSHSGVQALRQESRVQDVP